MKTGPSTMVSAVAVIVLPDARSLAQHAAELVRDTTREVVADRGERLCRALRRIDSEGHGRHPRRGTCSWTKCRGDRSIFLGRRAWVPIESPESNAGEAIRGFLTRAGSRAPGHPFETSAIQPNLPRTMSA